MKGLLYEKKIAKMRRKLQFFQNRGGRQNNAADFCNMRVTKQHSKALRWFL
jgi:hypothetical protein